MKKNMMKTGDFPFHFGTIASGDYFYDRAEDAAKLHDLIAGGQNVVLYAPRRYGKSSLAMKTAEAWKKDGFACIYFDLMRVESIDEFIRSYANAAIAVEGPTEHGIKTILSALTSIHPKFTVADDGKPVIELDFGRKGPTAKSLEEVLALPETLSSAKRRIVVIFDEFQEVATLSRHLPVERIFRSVIQHQRKTRYLFLGSKTHLMRRMFNDRTRPFYNSASTMQLPKPPEAESAAFLRTRFRSTGMEVSDEVVERIINVSNNIPYYIQAVALHTWLSANRSGDGKPTANDVSMALDELVEMRRDVYEAIAERLGETARRILSSLALEPTVRFDADYRARHALPGTTTIGSALTKLVNDGLVEKDSAGCHVADPLHAIYLRASAARVL
ncbi:MAG: ATP-binding protein [Kiritimatiellae bacterium]|nr:ATP-binding protein [Kiritimatiellia bacterium]